MWKSVSDSCKWGISFYYYHIVIAKIPQIACCGRARLSVAGPSSFQPDTVLTHCCVLSFCNAAQPFTRFYFHRSPCIITQTDSELQMSQFNAWAVKLCLIQLLHLIVLSPYSKMPPIRLHIYSLKLASRLRWAEDLCDEATLNEWLTLFFCRKVPVLTPSCTESLSVSNTGLHVLPVCGKHAFLGWLDANTASRCEWRTRVAVLWRVRDSRPLQGVFTQKMEGLSKTFKEFVTFWTLPAGQNNFPLRIKEVITKPNFL